ncbi:MAG: oxepin-CoA hydrolase/3-oxo-5,6-dehydrosuberyl-CoA semialdehyde dehydrogenase [Flavobacteriaceae bacterium]|jgi:oxepin-CoA hydrolase/3-oxo-5,6-dehydrosuberyl-CoA semialdehyde dehydrogenase
MADFLEPNLEVFLDKLNDLSSDIPAQWGTMNLQQMIEHLSNSLDLSIGQLETKLSIDEEHVPRAVESLISEKPMPRGFKVAYAPENPVVRNESLELAIDELATKWVDFEEYYMEKSDAKNLHPMYGHLDYTLWLRVHSKHFTHHFEQFDL